MGNFAGKIAVITGAASGLGREFARHAARLDMRLVLADIETDALAQTEAELKAAGTQLFTMVCDVAHAEQVQELAWTTMARFGVPNLLFNNAGVGAGGLIWEHEVADWEWLLGVNLFGVVHGIRAFTPLMLKAAQKNAAWHGHIVNTASIAGLQNMPNMGIYNVSKHAVVSLTETLYQDLRLIEAPIGVSLLCPFFVPTRIHASARNRLHDKPVALTASQRVAQAFSEKAVEAGKISAAQVAALTFDAIRENRFYVYSEQEPLEHARQRMEDMLKANNPRDPYHAVPNVRDSLRLKVLGGE